MPKHWVRYLVVVPRPMPTAPRRYLIIVAGRLLAAVVCHRYLIVVPGLLLAAPFLVRRRYLIVVPRPLPVAPLAVRRTYLIVLPLPETKLFPVATRRYRSRIRTRGRKAEEQIKYYQLLVHRGKVPLAAMYLRRVGDLAVVWRHRRSCGIKPRLSLRRRRYVINMFARS
jgi:hypothetical protein